MSHFLSTVPWANFSDMCCFKTISNFHLGCFPSQLLCTLVKRSRKWRCNLILVPNISVQDKKILYLSGLGRVLQMTLIPSVFWHLSPPPPLARLTPILASRPGLNTPPPGWEESAPMTPMWPCYTFLLEWFLPAYFRGIYLIKLILEVHTRQTLKWKVLLASRIKFWLHNRFKVINSMIPHGRSSKQQFARWESLKLMGVN